MTQKPCLTLLALSLLALGLASSAGAQIRTDGSANGRPTQLQGPDYRIDPSLGRLSGSNLFHSFENFQLRRGESATFSTQSLPVTQVISRVTGGTPSTISGLLRLDAGNTQPGFWFINPAGLVFGDGARIEVPGAFHASTAAQLRFSDGTRWDARSTSSSFVSAAPEAFGFLGAAASLRVASGASLNPAAQQALSLSAGDISIDGGTVVASGGLRLAASGSATVDVGVAGALPALGGAVSLSNGGQLVVRAEGSQAGGALLLSAGTLAMDGGSLLASLTRQSSSGAGPDIDLRLTGSLLMRGESSVQTQTVTNAPGGALRLQAASAQLDQGAYLQTRSDGAGTGGALQLQLSGLLQLSSGASLFGLNTGNGTGGAIQAQAQDIRLDSEAYVQSSSNGSGASGAVALTAARDLRLSGGASVNGTLEGSGSGGGALLRAGNLLQLDGGGKVDFSTSGSGSTGALRLEASTLRLDGASSVSHSVSGGTGGTGGTLLLASGLMELRNGSAVRAATDGGPSGSLQLQAGTLSLIDASAFNIALGVGSRAGNLSLLASGGLLLQGTTLFNLGRFGGVAGDILLQAQDVRIANASSLIASSIDPESVAGSIRLSATRSLWVSQGSQLSVSTSSTRDAGNVVLQAADLKVDGGSTIGSSSFGFGGSAGSVQLISSGALRVDGATLQSAAEVQGNAGSLLLRGQDVTVTGGSLLFSSLNVDQAGRGGDVLIEAARRLEVSGASQLDSSSFGRVGNAGSVRLTAGTELLVDSGQISGFTTGNGAGGNVSLTSAGQLLVRNGSLMSTSTLAAGAAGNLRLEGASLRIDASRLSSDSLPNSSGAGGRIELLSSGALELANGSLVTASTGGSGAAGSVALRGGAVLLRDASRVAAVAFAGSSGQTGNIDIVGIELIRLQGGSQALITNQARVANPALLQPTQLRLQAPRIELDASQVSAAATGNADASRIELLADSSLQLSDSQVSTAAQDGNGGSLRVSAARQIKLTRSALTTSVFGQQGNGGDILVQTEPEGLLLLNGGFIQANTAARNARGGNVRIEVGAVVASDNQVIVGGDQALRFDPQRFPRLNVIQAAAPDGVSGVVRVSGSVDLAGALALLDRRLLDPGRLGRSPCERPGGSALALSGRGGLPPPAAGLLGAPEGARSGQQAMTVACR